MFGLVSPASAHDPIFLTEDQKTPETGPYLPDGTISFAIYGTLLGPDDTRGLEFDLRDGDDLFLQILIPDLEPEISLAEADLPYMELATPSGELREIKPDKREKFADPFSGTNYVTLYETVEPGVDGGRYQVVVKGDAATRFAVAVGTSEEFFTPTQRSVDKPTDFAGIAEPLGIWYSTPAGEEPQGAPQESVDVDVDMIEDELEAMAEAEAAEADPAEAEASESPVEDSEEASISEEGAVGNDTDDDDSNSLGWVAPSLLIAVLAGGAIVFMKRRIA